MAGVFLVASQDIDSRAPRNSPVRSTVGLQLARCCPVMRGKCPSPPAKHADRPRVVPAAIPRAASPGVASCAESSHPSTIALVLSSTWSARSSWRHRRSGSRLRLVAEGLVRIVGRQRAEAIVPVGLLRGEITTAATTRPVGAAAYARPRHVGRRRSRPTSLPLDNMEELARGCRRVRHSPRGPRGKSSR